MEAPFPASVDLMPTPNPSLVFFPAALTVSDARSLRNSKRSDYSRSPRRSSAEARSNDDA
jgi:hypothetical protein